MQQLRWTILLIAVCVSLTGICQADHLTKRTDVSTHHKTTFDNRTAHVLYSLVSLLHTNASDLNEQTSHANPEKKAFAQLLVYLKNHNLFLQNSCGRQPGYNPAPESPDRKNYYLYALHKLIV